MFGMTGQSQALYNAPGMYCYWFLSNQRERDRPTMTELWKTHGTRLILIGCVYFTARDTRITYNADEAKGKIQNVKYFLFSSTFQGFREYLSTFQGLK